MRLGDLDALKAHISELLLIYSLTDHSDEELDNAILNAIDNASTVDERPQGDLINREDLKEEIRKHTEYYADRTAEDRYNVGYTECACEILDFIDNAPTVVPERPQGKWVWIHPLQENDEGAYMCSVCHCGSWDINPESKSCPYCNADMRGNSYE